jgi:hypothetical protein
MTTLLHGQPVEVGTLQYPRHLHRSGGEFLIVANAEDAALALADGWTLSPDAPAVVDAPPDVQEAEPIVGPPDPAVPPVAARKKPGRSRKV